MVPRGGQRLAANATIMHERAEISCEPAELSRPNTRISERSGRRSRPQFDLKRLFGCALKKRKTAGKRLHLGGNSQISQRRHRRSADFAGEVRASTPELSSLPCVCFGARDATTTGVSCVSPVRKRRGRRNTMKHDRLTTLRHQETISVESLTALDLRKGTICRTTLSNVVGLYFVIAQFFESNFSDCSEAPLFSLRYSPSEEKG